MSEFLFTKQWIRSLNIHCLQNRSFRFAFTYIANPFHSISTDSRVDNFDFLDSFSKVYDQTRKLDVGVSLYETMVPIIKYLLIRESTVSTLSTHSSKFMIKSIRKFNVGVSPYETMNSIIEHSLSPKSVISICIHLHCKSISFNIYWLESRQFRFPRLILQILL